MNNSSRTDNNGNAENLKTLLKNSEKHSLVKKVVKKKKVLSVFDVLLSSLIITPLVVFTWGSVWPLVDNYYLYLFPVYPCLWFSTCILCGFSMVGKILDYIFSGLSQNLCSKFSYKLVRFLYVYVFFICNILHWRGLWAVYASYITTNLQIYCVSLVCLVGLVLLKSLKNGVGCPFVIGVDVDEGFFDVPSRFRIGVSYLFINTYISTGCPILVLLFFLCE